MQRTIVGLFLVISGMLTSCKTTYTDPGWLLATDYYPLEVGKTVIYRLDSIQYHETIANDTISLDLKEVIADTYVDGNGQQVYRIERFISEPGINDWVLNEVWSATDNGGKLERTEQNMRFVRLVSPVVEGSSWDGHVYLGDLSSLPVDEQCNNLEFLNGWNFRLAEVGLPYQAGDLSFDNTVLVEQTGSQNLIEYNYCEERYARGVGLVYRFFRHYTTQTICPECIWEENVECGYSVKMTVISYN